MRSGRLGGGPRRENCNAARQTAWRLMLEEVIMQEISHRILDEVKKTVIGKDAVVRKVYMAILAGGHILLEDIPGVGKTTLALAFSKAMFSFNTFTFSVPKSPNKGFSIVLSTISFTCSSCIPRACATLFTCT